MIELPVGHMHKEHPSAESEPDLAAGSLNDVRWRSAALLWLTDTPNSWLSRLPVRKQPCVCYICICVLFRLLIFIGVCVNSGIRQIS